MKILLFGSIIYQLLLTANAKPGFGGSWTSPHFAFTVGAGATDTPSPPPVPETTVVDHSASPEPSNPPPPPPPAPPDTFVTTSDPTMTIFYDAMEECSQQFFNSTYVKQCSTLCSRIRINLIPCQRATDKNGELTCSTPADPACTLNKIHSCAIAQITDQTQLMSYLACTMSGTQVLPDFTACANLNKVDDAALQLCAKSDTGKNLCAGHSSKIMSDMNTIPGFIFKKPEQIKTTDLFEHLDYYRNHICYNDVQSAVCAQLKVIKAPTLPPECDQKLVLGIFYKAMDEKSQKWFHQLGSIYDQFNDHINFKYQPCMFAELSADEKLDCQDEHDPDCLVGKTHACAVWLVTEPKTLYQFLNCTMQDPKTLPDIEKCAADLKIPYDPIKTCANNTRGTSLCYDSSKTRPNTGDIPMFSFELTFDEDTSKKTVTATNLQSIFCEQLKKYSITLPNECKSSCYAG